MLLIMVSSLPSEEEEFFLEIYQKYYPYAKKYMMSKLKNQSELEDAIQMAFIALIPKVKLLKSFNEYKLNYYIVKTFRSKCMDFNRKYWEKMGYEIPIETDDAEMQSLMEKIPADIISMEEQTDECDEYSRRANFLAEIFSKLPERHRDILLFKYFYGMSNEKIGEQLGIKEQNVGMYIKRARDFVKKMWTLGGALR